MHFIKISILCNIKLKKVIQKSQTICDNETNKQKNDGLSCPIMGQINKNLFFDVKV